MTLDQFVQLLDTYGADLRHWPGEHRADGEHLRDSSPAAHARWLAAERLDSLLRRDASGGDDPVRQAAIVDVVLRRIRAFPKRSTDWRWLFSRPAGAALAATAFAGWLAAAISGPSLPLQHDRGIPAINALLNFEVTDIENPL
jgi:hypothetical protein